MAAHSLTHPHTMRYMVCYNYRKYIRLNKSAKLKRMKPYKFLYLDTYRPCGLVRTVVEHRIAYNEHVFVSKCFPFTPSTSYFEHFWCFIFYVAAAAVVVVVVVVSFSFASFATKKDYVRWAWREIQIRNFRWIFASTCRSSLLVYVCKIFSFPFLRHSFCAMRAHEARNEK